MKRKAIAALLTLLLLSFAAPSAALADSHAVYVSSGGSDKNSGMSAAEPVATLAKAAELVNNGEGKDYTVYVMTDLVSTASARFFDKNVTITSYDGKATVSRGEGFAAASDSARGLYNPAMVEIQTSQGEASLTLSDIIFDDCGKHEGYVFSQAVSGDDTVDNTVYVQDAIIASNATYDCTITLGSGAELRNFGGMSAVRATGKASVKMESGSIITDTTVTGRGKDSSDKVSDGPAGAVWLQGGALVTEEGSEIKDLFGRAVYADGGNVNLGGTVSGMSYSDGMWMGANGIVLHLRNGAEGTLASTCVIDNTGTVGGKESAIYVEGCTLTAQKGSVIKNFDKTTGIAACYAAVVDFNGEITGFTGDAHAFNLQNSDKEGEGFDVTLGPYAYIHDNQSGYGTIYLQGYNSQLHIYGRINDNISSDRGGALAMANNLGLSTVTMYDGAEICGNYSEQTGGGIMVSVGDFIMKGGTISGNISKDEGGGVFVRRGGTFVMEGGKVENNASASVGGGVAYEAGDYRDGIPNVDLQGGAVSDNVMKAQISKDAETGKYSVVDKENAAANDLAVLSSSGGKYFSNTGRNMFISSEAEVDNKSVYFVDDNKTVTPCDTDVALGNASPESISDLKESSKQLGWSNPLASFWTQRDGSSVLTVGGLSPDEGLPVYALVIAVDEDGNPAADAELRVFDTQKTEDGIAVTLSAGFANGCAVALVQPASDLGSAVITTDVTVIYDTDKAEDDTYEVPYLTTYTMSKSLLSQLKAIVAGFEDEEPLDVGEFKFVVELDPRLAAKLKEDGSGYEFVFDGAGILDVNEKEVTLDGNKLIVPCTPVKGWSKVIKKLSENAEVVMTLTGTGVLKAEDFLAGDTLDTTGHIEVTFNGIGDGVIPANVCMTEMKKTETYTVTYTDGVDGEEVFADQVFGNILPGTKTPAFEGTPYRKGYTFKGWTPEVSETVTGDAVYTALWEQGTPVPKTGDNSGVMLWAAVLVIAAVVMTGVIVSLKKKKPNR